MGETKNLTPQDGKPVAKEETKEQLLEKVQQLMTICSQLKAQNEQCIMQLTARQTAETIQYTGFMLGIVKNAETFEKYNCSKLVDHALKALEDTFLTDEPQEESLDTDME